MAGFTAKVIESGRITIPDAVREMLGLKVGDFVMVEVDKMKTEEK